MDIKKLKAIGATYLRAGIAAGVALFARGIICHLVVIESDKACPLFPLND